MKKQKIKKLISFDFDDTLFHTPLPEEGKKIWKEKTGKDWPHRGWWSKPESLDTEIFDIPINLNIYEKYEKAVSDPSNYVILATGRIKPLEAEVFNILDTYNFNFDEIHLNPGIDTYEFKSNLFEKLINELQPEEFIMYDDRKEHLIRFVEWAKNMPCKVTLIDAISGKEFKSEEDKKLQEQISRMKSMMMILKEDEKKTISYSAVVLDRESSELLLEIFMNEIPDGWKKYAHHMTIALGKAVEDENLLGSLQTLIVTQIGKSDMAIAVRVEGFPSKNKIPHVTLAVNPEGGKPFMSNKIEEWKDIEPFEIIGEVRNIYN